MNEDRRPAIWSPEALADLEAMWDYYAAAAGAATAEKMVREVAALIQSIEEYPLIGRVRDEVRSELRSLASKPNVIFYRVKDSVPQIVRVLDGRQDIEDIFSE